MEGFDELCGGSCGFRRGLGLCQQGSCQDEGEEGWAEPAMERMGWEHVVPGSERCRASVKAVEAEIKMHGE
jgi:hypothetical protein